MPPAPPTRHGDRRHCWVVAFPVGHAPTKSPLISDDPRATGTHSKGTRTVMHTHIPRPSLSVTGSKKTPRQGLILTESLPLYILCPKTEYTKGNLALSTKQWHWAGPSLWFSGLASSPGIRPREGWDMRTGRPEGRHLLPGVCPWVSSPSHGAQGGAETPVPLHCNRHRVQESLQPRTHS